MKRLAMHTYEAMFIVGGVTLAYDAAKYVTKHAFR